MLANNVLVLLYVALTVRVVRQVNNYILFNTKMNIVFYSCLYGIFQCLLACSGEMSSRSAFAPSGFSSTPVTRRSTQGKAALHKQSPLDFDVGIVSDDEDTFSLLSPIYHDSFDSGENCSQSSGQSSPKEIDAHVLERYVNCYIHFHLVEI